MIHEKLYQSEALQDIGFDAYLKELVNTVHNTYDSEELSVDIAYDLSPVDVNIDQAIPCSLIVNEVIVNCYKHAFNDIEEGRIEITSQYDDPDFIIHIADNGSGLPDNVDVTQQQSLGMTLVQALAQQLGGEIRFSSDGQNGGTQFELRFEKEEKV